MRNDKIIILISIFTLFLFVNNVYALQIPYDGMTLKWDYEYEYTVDEYPTYNTKTTDELIYTYAEIENSTFRQTNLDDGSDNLIDVNTRKFLTGDNKGNSTSHWISNDIKIGDKIEINGLEYIVTSLSEDIYLDDFGKIETIELSYTDDLDSFMFDGSTYTDWHDDFKIYYNKEIPIKLKYIYKITYSQFAEYLSIMHKTEENTLELKENNIDTDGDGLTDLKEMINLKSNPALSDTDGDGLTDLEEFNGIDGIKTNLIDDDSDDDGLKDGEEISFNSNPILSDTDGDGLTDLEEKNFNSSPILIDTDGDGLTDKQEEESDLNPTNIDTDGDGLNDKLDPFPNSIIFPWGMIIFIIGLIVFYWKFVKLKKRIKNKRQK